MHLTLVSEDSKKSKEERVEVYVGWTGMASASSLAQFNAGQNGERGFETIEIDPQYAQSLGLNLNDIVCSISSNQQCTRLIYHKVEIGLLHDVPPAKFVGTEPVTSDDWEIIVTTPLLQIIY